MVQKQRADDDIEAIRQSVPQDIPLLKTDVAAAIVALPRSKLQSPLADLDPQDFEFYPRPLPFPPQRQRNIPAPRRHIQNPQPVLLPLAGESNHRRPYTPGAGAQKVDRSQPPQCAEKLFLFQRRIINIFRLHDSLSQIAFGHGASLKVGSGRGKSTIIRRIGMAIVDEKPWRTES